MINYCAVCGEEVREEDNWFYHARLDAYICIDCPLTDVRGEDITGHTMYWHINKDQDLDVAYWAGYNAAKAENA